MWARMKRMWRWFRTPSGGIAAGTLILGGVLFAAVSWPTFNSVLASTNTLDFCTGCHEMRAYVFEEYSHTVHYQNSSGVRAICADCHVPHALGPKLLRKAKATMIEVPRHLMGALSTREKFEANRQRLAENVWREMKANDSLQCRNCHSVDAMALTKQKPRARNQHEDALENGETCIDCHKGIAHKLPPMAHLPEEGGEEAAVEDEFQNEFE